MNAFRHIRFLLCAATVVVTALAITSTAAAQCGSPGGGGAVDQYCPSLPEPGGDGAPGGDGGPGGGPLGGGPGGAGFAGGSGGGLSAETRSTLLGFGLEGQGVLALAEGSVAMASQGGSGGGPGASGESVGGRADGNSDGGAAESAAEELPGDADDAGGTLDGLTSAVGDGVTSGEGFVWILIALALALVAEAWLRYRRTGAGPG